jgi:hypothetical protein
VRQCLLRSAPQPSPPLDVSLNNMKYRTSHIFVPGGMPRHTYVPRSSRKLEETLQESKDNLCKLVTLTGATKSGKTVLTKTIFSDSDTIWIDGGSISEENDFWTQILEHINGYSDIEGAEQTSSSEDLKGSVGAEAGLPLFKVKSSVTGSTGNTLSNSTKASRNLTPRAASLTQMRKAMIPLVVDDFHYIDRKLQGSIIRALKPLIFDGQPVVILAIPHRRYDALRVEREMTSRIESVKIPSWDPEELSLIAEEGFPLLNVGVSVEILEGFTAQAYGSPHLMQEFCRELMRMQDIKKTQDKLIQIDSIPEGLFETVAEKTGRIMFDKLSSGPRQRADRLQRSLKSGDSADIYKVVLLALVSLAPGIDTIEYEQLRTAIRDQLTDNIPQSHEVSRVLDKMAEIAADDEASTPVIDWEKEEQRLHITDPFFAYYLKWGTTKD